MPPHLPPDDVIDHLMSEIEDFPEAVIACMLACPSWWGWAVIENFITWCNATKGQGKSKGPNCPLWLGRIDEKGKGKGQDGTRPKDGKGKGMSKGTGLHYQNRVINTLPVPPPPAAPFRALPPPPAISTLPVPPPPAAQFCALPPPPPLPVLRSTAEVAGHSAYKNCQIRKRSTSIYRVEKEMTTGGTDFQTLEEDWSDDGTVVE